MFYIFNLFVLFQSITFDDTTVILVHYIICHWPIPLPSSSDPSTYVWWDSYIINPTPSLLFFFVWCNSIIVSYKLLIPCRLRFLDSIVSWNTYSPCLLLVRPTSHNLYTLRNILFSILSSCSRSRRTRNAHTSNIK